MTSKGSLTRGAPAKLVYAASGSHSIPLLKLGLPLLTLYNAAPPPLARYLLESNLSLLGDVCCGLPSDPTGPAITVQPWNLVWCEGALDYSTRIRTSRKRQNENVVAVCIG